MMNLLISTASQVEFVNHPSMIVYPYNLLHIFYNSQIGAFSSQLRVKQDRWEPGRRPSRWQPPIFVISLSQVIILVFKDRTF